MRRLLRLAAVLIALTAYLGIWSCVIEPDLLRVRQMDLESEWWPSSAPPLRVMVIADLHVGAPHIDLDKVSEVVARSNALKPDLVLLLGDYIGRGVLFGGFEPPEPIAARLKPLRAKHGVYTVLGNHDWWFDGPRVEQALRTVGIPVLENQAVPINLPGGRLWIAGIADDSTRAPEVVRTVAPLPQGEPVLIIAHDPAIYRDVPDRVMLTLAGHTHGGQVYLPGIGAVLVPGRAPRRHAYGMIEEGGRKMYVTGGVGTSIIPMRLNMPPEIVLFTIRSKPGPARTASGS